MADAADSKSAAPCGRVGSTPISGTKGLLNLAPKKTEGHPSGAPLRPEVRRGAGQLSGQFPA